MNESAETKQQAKIFSALADPVRLGILQQLKDGKEHASTAVADRLGISLALFCHHSRILVEAGVVLKRKEAQTAYLRANRSLLRDCMKLLLA